jgi:hypothetical protein
LISTEGSISAEDLLKYTTSLLSIVLSHHYQKEEVLSMLRDTQVDFAKVRDTMYKYSKKVEERFFSEPAYAYFFAQFSCSHSGKQYIQNKLSKVDMSAEQDRKFKNSREMNERLVTEIEMMTLEAKQFLVRHYLDSGDSALTLNLLRNLGIDCERLVILKTQGIRSSKPVVDSILQEVRFEQ